MSTSEHETSVAHGAAAPGRRCCWLALLLVAGCADVWERDGHLRFEVPPEELEGVNPIDLDSYSTSAPVTVEEAATIENLRRITAPKAAPESFALDIEQMRADALRNNLDLEVELIDPAIAATLIDEEEARFESTFRGSARYAKIERPAELATESSQSESSNFEVGLNVPLVTGGNIDLSVPFNRNDTNNIFSLLNPAFDTTARFSISQPLLRDAGTRTNLHSVRVARGEEQIAGAQTKLEAIRILANADRTYWSLYAAQQELMVRRQEHELALEQLETARRRVRAGDRAEIEIVRAESGVAETVSAIIRADTEVRRRQRELKRIMNREDLPINSPTRIDLATRPDPVWMALDPHALAEFAVDNRMEMLELELRLAIDASTITFEQNQELPLFVVDYTYGLNGLGDSFRDAFGQIPDRSFEDHTFGFRAEIPIGNEGAKARVSRALLTRLQRLATRRQRDLAIRQEVLDALDALEENWQRILAARQEARLTGRTYEAEVRQFEVGARTSTDVLDAAANLADAQSREVRSLADYEIARVDLAFATGTLLGQARIRWGAYVRP